MIYQFTASLTSYGFRGEALSSLCAVADVTITTKTKESSMGHIYTFTHQGDVATKKPAATPKGRYECEFPDFIQTSSGPCI